MSKNKKGESRKQIKAQLINEVTAQYRHEVDHWKENYNRMRDIADKAEKERDEAKKRALAAEAKLAEYEDWIERLQDFCNLSDEDREKAIAKMKADSESESKYNVYLEHFNMWNKFLGAMFV